MKKVSYEAIITGKRVGHIYILIKKNIPGKKIRKIKELQKIAKWKINFPTHREILKLQGNIFLFCL